MSKEEKLVFPHHTPEWIKLSMRIFMAMTMSYDYMKNVMEWWEDGCLEMCCWLEENDDNDEYLIQVYNALEVLYECIYKARTTGKELNEKAIEEVEKLSKDKETE